LIVKFGLDLDPRFSLDPVSVTLLCILQLFEYQIWMKFIIILFRRFGSDSRASSRLDSSAALDSPGWDSPRPPPTSGARVESRDSQPRDTQSRDSQPRDIQPGRAHDRNPSGRSSALARERTNSSSPVFSNNRNAGGVTTAAVDRIDRLLDAPDKIHIPERLAPEPEDEGRRSREETERRREKVESIRRMLGEGESGKTESLLTLNQIIARQVKQRSRSFATAAAAAAAQGEESSATAGKNVDYDDERSDSSPDIPLPLRQQRESFLI
jgi:hypothetical protein